MEQPDSPQNPEEATIALSNALVRLAAATERLVERIEHHEQEAESRIDDKLRRADTDAADQMERARFAAASLVENRRREIGSLSDEIVTQATALTAGLADGARVRAQFGRFVEALSVAAERLAQESAALPREGYSRSDSDSGLSRTERTVPLIRTGPSSSISTSRPASPASGSEAAA